MPAQKTKSIFSGKARQRWEERKTEEVQLPSGGGGLPPGVEGGVAKLVSLSWQLPDRKGDLPRASIRGVALEPKQHDGVPIEGIQDFFNLPGGRPKDESELVDRTIGLLQRLGVNTEDLDWDSVEDGTLFEEIVKSDVHFRFRTWRGQPTAEYPDPRTNRIFLGGTTYNGAMEDDVQEEEEETETEPETTTDDLVDAIESRTLSELAEAADGGDEKAQNELTEAALEAGVSQDDVDIAENWSDIAAMIDAGGSTDDESDKETHADQSQDPEKGDVFSYKPPRARKLVEVEILAVNTDKQICNVRRLDDGRTYKGVPWGNLAEIAS